MHVDFQVLNEMQSISLMMCFNHFLKLVSSSQPCLKEPIPTHTIELKLGVERTTKAWRSLQSSFNFHLQNMAIREFGREDCYCHVYHVCHHPVYSWNGNPLVRCLNIAPTLGGSFFMWTLKWCTWVVMKYNTFIWEIYTEKCMYTY